MIDWQLALLALTACLAAFLTVALYRGVRLEKPAASPGPASILGHFPDGLIDLRGADFGSAGGDSLVGWVATVIFTVVATIAFWMALQLLLLLVVPLLFAIYLACDRVLRSVLVRSRACRGNLRLSLKRGLTYAVAGMSVVNAATWLAWIVLARR